MGTIMGKKAVKSSKIFPKESENDAEKLRQEYMRRRIDNAVRNNIENIENEQSQRLRIEGLEAYDFGKRRW